MRGSFKPLHNTVCLEREVYRVAHYIPLTVKYWKTDILVAYIV